MNEILELNNLQGFDIYLIITITPRSTLIQCGSVY